MALQIRKGDLVQVISGADRGKRGRVIAVDLERRRVRVDKVRMMKHHLKPGRRGARTGGIIEREAYVDLSNVMLLDPSSGKPSRVRVVRKGDQSQRVFVKSGEPVPAPVGSS